MKFKPFEIENFLQIQTPAGGQPHPILIAIQQKAPDPVLGLHVARVLAKFKEEARTVQETRQGIVQKYALVEDDKILTEADGKTPRWNDGLGGEPAARKEIEKMLMAEIDINIASLQIDAKDLKSFTIEEIEFLLPILDVEEKQ